MAPRAPNTLSDDGSVTIDLNAADPPRQETDQQQPQRKAGPPYVDRVALDPPPERLPPPPEEEGLDLEKQLRDMQKREKAANDRATLERQQRLASEQRSQAQVTQTGFEKEQSDYYSVTNALAAKTGELNQAKADYANAIAAGDHAQATEINDRMIDLRIDIRDLNAGKVDFEARFESRRRAPPQRQQPQPSQDIETILATMPQLLPSEKEWARKHPDVVFDGRKFKKLEAAFLDSEDRGIERGSDEYFQFFDQRLGYDEQGDYDNRDTEQAMTTQQQRQPPPVQPRRPQAAAPVSRSAPGASTAHASGGGDKVTLSPQQREAARFSGVDERVYARNVQRLNDLKRRGYYQETG